MLKRLLIAVAQAFAVMTASAAPVILAGETFNMELNGQRLGSVRLDGIRFGQGPQEYRFLDLGGNEQRVTVLTGQFGGAGGYPDHWFAYALLEMDGAIWGANDAGSLRLGDTDPLATSDGSKLLYSHAYGMRGDRLGYYEYLMNTGDWGSLAPWDGKVRGGNAHEFAGAAGTGVNRAGFQLTFKRPTNEVPEPSALMLAGLGLLPVVWWRRSSTQAGRKAA